MNIIFLDIDGVLVTRKSMQKELMLGRTVGRDSFACSCVDILNRVIVATNAKIVISSSWRFGWSLNELKEIFALNGVIGDIISITPKNIGDVERGEEISAWLANNIISTNICIIDDDSDMKGVEEFLVKTTFENGLEEHHVKLVIDMLTKK